MNYAFMSFSCPELRLEEMLSVAKTTGYGGIEPRAGAGHAHGVELGANQAERRGMMDRAGEAGVSICCLAVSCHYADPAGAQVQIEETHAYIDLAADVGAPRLRVFGGRIPDGIERGAAIESVARQLSAVADHAGERNVAICLETHDDWCDPAHVVAVMKLVDHPAVAVNWDVLHPVRTAGFSLPDSFALLRPWTQHVHIHDATLATDRIEYVAMGSGAIDHHAVLQLLKDAGYAGYLSGEWIGWEPYAVHLPRELATLQQYEAALE